MTNRNDLKNIIEEMTESLGCECVAVDIKTDKRATTLRVFIDTPDGVKHEDCERVSRAIAEYMDAREEEGAPWFDGKYFVEVSSPGLERPLFKVEHYRRFAGKHAKLSLKSGKKISGIIDSEDGGVIVIAPGGDEPLERIPFEDIKRANLVFVIEKGEKKSNTKQTKKNKK